jgi:alpha-ketoglutarate-dependent taurine dioxygenase
VCLLQHASRVNRDGKTCDIASFVGGEEQYGVADVYRFNPADGQHVHELGSDGEVIRTGILANDVPAKATVLTARHVAMQGGGTEFASTYAAYDQLPAADRERYEGLRVVHSFEAAQRLVNSTPSEADLAMWRKMPTHETSLVWHRRDGRSSLAIGATADHIVGMDAAESRALLDDLLAWTTQERFCHKHDWAVGDVVVWDNTGMLHRALPYDPGSQRTMHRTTIQGDEPWA